MHEPAATTDYADRRQDPRRPASRRAELLAANNAQGVDCVILDESDGGVQIETAEPLDLPEQIIIKFSPHSSQLVRRCWAKGTRAGYQYIDIVPASRRKPLDMPASASRAERPPAVTLPSAKSMSAGSKPSRCATSPRSLTQAA